MLSTGMAHRLNVWVLLHEGINPNDLEQLELYLSRLELHFDVQNNVLTPNINGYGIPPDELDSDEVRKWLPRITRRPEVGRGLAARFRTATAGMRLVAEGHGLGTGIFPEAGHKFFCDAPTEIRIERRWRQRCAASEVISREEVGRELRERDASDAMREVNPVRQLPDMVVVDTGKLTPDECLKLMLEVLD